MGVCTPYCIGGPGGIGDWLKIYWIFFYYTWMRWNHLICPPESNQPNPEGDIHVKNKNKRKQTGILQKLILFTQHVLFVLMWFYLLHSSVSMWKEKRKKKTNTKCSKVVIYCENTIRAFYRQETRKHSRKRRRIELLTYSICFVVPTKYSPSINNHFCCSSVD